MNVFLQKEQGNTYLHRKRTIQLFESDFNFNNKITGQRIMKNGKNHKLIAPEQYGGRKQHRAIHQALKCCIYNDIVCQEKRSAIISSNDAKANFDQVVHSIVFMALQRMGISCNATKGMTNIFQRMCHHVRTAYGDSDQFVTSLHHFIDFQGTGQGNGAATAIWAAISTVVINA